MVKSLSPLPCPLILCFALAKLKALCKEGCCYYAHFTDWAADVERREAIVPSSSLSTLIGNNYEQELDLMAIKIAYQYIATHCTLWQVYESNLKPQGKKEMEEEYPLSRLKKKQEGPYIFPISFQMHLSAT